MNRIKPALLPALYVSVAITALMVLMAPSWFKVREFAMFFAVMYGLVVIVLATRLVYRDPFGRYQFSPWFIAFIGALVVLSFIRLP